MTIADRYYILTGRTVSEACRILHEKGVSIESAAHTIGFSTSSDLRRYLACRQITCPWPKMTRTRKAPYVISVAALARYVALLESGISSRKAAALVGHDRGCLRAALLRTLPAR